MTRFFFSFFFPVGSAGMFYFLLHFSGSWHDGRFPGEVGISSGTRSPWSQNITPMGGWGRWWGSEPLKFQCCSSSQMLSYAPQQSLWEGISWERWGQSELGEVASVFLCSPLGNGDSQTTATLPFVSGINHMCLCHSWTVSPFVWDVDIVLFNSTLLLFLFVYLFFSGAHC